MRARINGDERKQRREENRRQRECLRAFDAELFTYTGQVAWFLPAIFSFILLVYFAIPVQEMDGDFFLPAFLSAWMPYFVRLPYTYGPFIDNKRESIRDRLRYLPVSQAQYVRVRMGYLLRFHWKLAAAGLVLQCLFALGIEKRIELWNVLYATGFLLLEPLAVGLVQLALENTFNRSLKED